MRKLLLIVALGVTVAMSMGLVIDARCRPPVDRPESRPTQESLSAVGRVEGASTEIELRPELSGRIAAVLIREGQEVEEGQVLLHLEDPQYRQEVAVAEADLALAKAQLDRLTNGAHQEQRVEAAALYQAKVAELERARGEWQRTRALFEARATSPQEEDNRRAAVLSMTKEVEAAKARLELVNAPARADEVQIAQARIQAAEARVELAKVQLGRTELRAPRHGQVLQAKVHAGEMAGPASTEPAVVLADTSRFQVRAFVEELDAPRVEVGMTATVTAEGLPGQELRGRVGRLSPRMTRKALLNDRPSERLDTKTREVWIELDTAAALVVGLRVDVRIRTDERSRDLPASK